MTSIYRRALGDRFDDLHPELQRHYDLHSSDGIAHVGRGRMAEIRRGPWYVRPALALGARWHLLFPERGSSIPFRLRNYAYRDRFDREAVAWIREFSLPTERRFDAAMVYSERRGGIVDYLGTRGNPVTDLHLSVAEDGGLRIRSDRMRLFAGPVRLPLPQTIAGTADVREWYDEDEDRFRVSVSVSNPVVGELSGYRGWFELEAVSIDRVPPDARPAKERRRE